MCCMINKNRPNINKVDYQDLDQTKNDENDRKK